MVAISREALEPLRCQKAKPMLRTATSEIATTACQGRNQDRQPLGILIIFIALAIIEILRIIAPAGLGCLIGGLVSGPLLRAIARRQIAIVGINRIGRLQRLLHRRLWIIGRLSRHWRRGVIGSPQFGGLNASVARLRENLAVRIRGGVVLAMDQPREFAERIVGSGGAFGPTQPPLEFAEIDRRASNGCLAHDAPRSLIPGGREAN